MATQLDNLSEEVRDELASLALKLSANPKTRKKFLTTIKEAAPNLSIPELDVPAGFEAALADRDKKFDDYRREQENKEMQRELLSKRDEVLNDFGFGKEDVEKIEKIMTERKVLNYKDAATLYNLEREPATPVVYGMSEGIGELPTDEGLMEDEQRWSLKTAHQMIDDMQRKKRNG